MSESLAATSGSLSTFEVPAIFQEPNDKIVGKFSTPYISFAHKNRIDEYGKLVAQFGMVSEGEMFLIEPGTTTKLDTAKLSLIKAKQFWAQKNAAGEILATSFTEMPWPWDEVIESVVLVYLDDRVVVANCQPRTTKCGGFKILAEALDDCQKPEWGDKSPAHKETMAINQPIMRYFGKVTLSDSRISKKSGLPYRTTTCSIHPTTNLEVKLLKAFMESSDCNKAMADAADRYQFRLKEIESKLKK